MMAKNDSFFTGPLWRKQIKHCVETTLVVRPPVTKPQRRTVWQIFMKFGVVLYQILTGKRDFRENWLSDLHTAFSAVCESLFILYIFLDRFGWNSVQDTRVMPSSDVLTDRTARVLVYWKGIFTCACKLISIHNFHIYSPIDDVVSKRNIATGDQERRNVMWPVLRTESKHSVLVQGERLPWNIVNIASY